MNHGEDQFCLCDELLDYFCKTTPVRPLSVISLWIFVQIICSIFPWPWTLTSKAQKFIICCQCQVTPVGPLSIHSGEMAPKMCCFFLTVSQFYHLQTEQPALSLLSDSDLIFGHQNPAVRWAMTPIWCNFLTNQPTIEHRQKRNDLLQLYWWR